jgi:vacuolar iron transporter family protein
MVEKELGLAVADTDKPLRGALIMGGSFGFASLVPILPYLFAPVSSALYVSVGLTVLMLFAMGSFKSRWTGRSWLVSGLEAVGLGAFAGIAGYLFGTLLPAGLGVAGLRG